MLSRALVLSLGLAVLAAAAPARGRLAVQVLAEASAFAVPGPGPVPIGTSSLPDARVYEQVSPVDKHGNYVASGGLPAVERNGYAAARADGNALVVLASGAIGHASSSVLGPYVARRSDAGWSTTSATPPQLGLVDIAGSPQKLIPSQDFSSFVFGAQLNYSLAQPSGGESVNLYLAEGAFTPPTWLGAPEAGYAQAFPKPGENFGHGGVADNQFVGTSPDLSVVYFTYSGTLVRADEARASNLVSGSGAVTEPVGFYEWTRTGGLRSAGVLPDGTVDAFGAVPAAMAGDGHQYFGAAQAVEFDNGVSADGTKAFFVSPDPGASSVTDPQCASPEATPCTSAAPELYVREALAGGGHRARLISQSQSPGHEGEPAPHGASAVLAAFTHAHGASYVYASADGKQAFFASEDPLTRAAQEAPAAPLYTYDFSLATGRLTWLPGVVGPVVAVARDGSRFLFENTATNPRELDLWSGPGAGTVRAVAPLPRPPAGEENVGLNVEGRASADGSVFVVNTNAPIPGFANNGTGFEELYRYDAGSDEFSCLSCAPAGSQPAGDAHISYNNHGGQNSKPSSTVDTRVISSDGARVFFDSPNALVPQAANGRRGVYEWERGGVGSCVESRGCLYLLSSGTASEDAYYLDNSESGSDVFFNTSAGLARADVDGAYDAYDARIPHPGDQLPPATASLCEGSACQPSPAPPDLGSSPASAAVSGAVGLVEPPPGSPVSPGLTRHQRLLAALRICRRRHTAHRRHGCERAARRRYGGRS